MTGELDDTHRKGPNGTAAGTLRLLTLNLGLLGFEPQSGWRIALASENRRRRAAAPRMLCATDADVIALQEVYSPADRRYLSHELAAQYPFSAESPRSHSIVGNGLMLFSRHPIAQSAFTPCLGAPWWTRLLWKQGFLVVELDLPVVGRTRVINVHLAAGLPIGDAEAHPSAENRERELSQLLAAAGADNPAEILIGDFNASDRIHAENYQRIIAAGYADAFVAASGATPNFPGFTWDAANPLNSRGRFRDAPSQRIDHVFVSKRFEKRLTPVAARVVFQDPIVSTKAGQFVCLSDHYGMLVTLAL
jgi:endonuclease/exonuclease/phosphatase family metal-dependent hydrolase